MSGAMSKSVRRFQTGLSLLELSIAVTIASVLLVMQLHQDSETLRNERMTKESDWVGKALADIQLQIGQTPNAAALADTTLGVLKSVPLDYVNKTVIGLTRVSNAYGGELHLSSLTLGEAVNGAYALTYSKLPKDTCARMIALMVNAASKSGAPLYAMVGDKRLLTEVPLTLGLNGDGTLFASGVDQTVLKSSGNQELDMAKVAAFCDGDSPRSLILVRRPKD